MSQVLYKRWIQTYFCKPVNYPSFRECWKCYRILIISSIIFKYSSSWVFPLKFLYYHCCKIFMHSLIWERLATRSKVISRNFWTLIKKLKKKKIKINRKIINLPIQKDAFMNKETLSNFQSRKSRVN